MTWDDFVGWLYLVLGGICGAVVGLLLLALKLAMLAVPILIVWFVITRC